MLNQGSDFRVTVPALLFDPTLMVFDFSPDRRLTKFLVADLAMLEQSPFIDIRFEPLARAHFWIDTHRLFELEGGHDVVRPRPAFVFHHAFVCSTLLARCLTQADAFFSLREPWILRRLADHKRAAGSGGPDARWDESVVKYLRLLCRNYRGGAIPVIKATNVANNLLGDVLRLFPDQPVLYLYSDLENFLVSNLKKKPDTQRKMAGLAQSFLSDGDLAVQQPQMADPSRLSLLQVCAVVWLSCLYNLRKTVAGYPQARVATLDSQAFLDDPAGALAQVAGHFGHRLDSGELGRMTDARILGTHAKEPSKSFGQKQRQAEMQEIRRRHGREIAEAIAWAEPALAATGVMDFMALLHVR
jgi:hypothetical protein